MSARRLTRAELQKEIEALETDLDLERRCHAHDVEVREAQIRSLRDDRAALLRTLNVLCSRGAS